LWKCRTLADGSLPDDAIDIYTRAGSRTGSGTRANTGAGSGSSARTGTRARTCAHAGSVSITGALGRRHPAGNDFAKPGSVEQHADSELLAGEHVDLYAEPRQRRIV
jgi:hypothetical protein